MNFRKSHYLAFWSLWEIKVREARVALSSRSSRRPLPEVLRMRAMATPIKFAILGFGKIAMVYVKMLSNLKKRYDARLGEIGWRLRPPPARQVLGK